MFEIEEKYGKPDYVKYPMIGYPYSACVDIVENRPLKDYEMLSFAMAAILPELEDSPLDHGHYVFAIMKDSSAVYIGTGEGKSRRNAIASAKKKYESGTVILLAYALSKRQAASVKQTLERRLKL